MFESDGKGKYGFCVSVHGPEKQLHPKTHDRTAVDVCATRPVIRFVFPGAALFVQSLVVQAVGLLEVAETLASVRSFISIEIALEVLHRHAKSVLPPGF